MLIFYLNTIFARSEVIAISNWVGCWPQLKYNSNFVAQFRGDGFNFMACDISMFIDLHQRVSNEQNYWSTNNFDGTMMMMINSVTNLDGSVLCRLKNAIEIPVGQFLWIFVVFFEDVV